MDRCTKRWEKVMHGDWIEAYDYLAPSERKNSSIQDFLKGKTNHRYENLERPRALKLQGDEGYVLVACLWTPIHPALHNLDLGKEDLTRRLEMVETWRRGEGDWYYLKAEYPSDFFAAHPEIPRPPTEEASR